MLTKAGSTVDAVASAELTTPKKRESPAAEEDTPQQHTLHPQPLPVHGMIYDSQVRGSVHAHF